MSHAAHVAVTDLAAAGEPALAERWGCSALQQCLQREAPGLRVEVLAETASTNTLLLDRAREGATGACLLVAERQTAGRGRHGRQWVSDLADAAAGAASEAMPGSGSLTVSFGRLLAPRRWQGLSLAVGVALAEALHPRVRLKWPNDLWLDGVPPASGRKLGGVLIETAAVRGLPTARYAVVGIGLNVVAPPRAPGWPQAAAGWSELDPAATAPALLARIAAPLLAALAQFEQHGFAPFAARYAARDLLAGRPVQVDGAGAAGGTLEGIADGVDADGALRLRTASGLLAVTSGDVSLSQAAPSVRLGR